MCFKVRTGVMNRLGCSMEKLAAEILWLGQKLAACGCAEEVVWKLAEASNLGWPALSAEPRLQGSLLKVSVFFFKQARDMDDKDETAEESNREEHRQTKLKMLTSWLPLLCVASNGTDIPVLSSGERAELERILEETIETLEPEKEQEQVLSLWLHHFTCSVSSDWPNLHASYTRWCNASRKLFLLQ
ncbi:1,8-cineole synthase [Quillaja saponaria]|uniref:1,8-cineole synthase n=1 Tax=Quillaja saponaria TaxID=32244 RepID=A0AAD7KVP0_QUISA|nr:1,8-cineole synthase [Quillaja saponaria]